MYIGLKKEIKMDRRDFIKQNAFIWMAAPLIARSESLWSSSANNAGETKNAICAFSKEFQWMDYDELSGFLSDAGFDGIDLSVRPDGHVLPENVERDLPLAVEAAHRHGLTIPMIVTNITNASDPLSEKVLRTASGLGIEYYRLGYYHYDTQLSIEQNMQRIKEQLTGICELNAKYGINGGYQNHAGNFFGNPVWDLWYLIKDMDSQYIGCQYDVYHAATESFTGWPFGFEAVASFVKHACIKDYTFTQNNKGKWELKTVPLGTGVVDYKKYFTLRRKHGIDGPLSIHYEFALEGDDVSLSVKERRKRILPAVRREVEVLRTFLLDT
jgi:sugar phosphate isomerase/epimerase